MTAGKIPVGFYGYGIRAFDALMEHPDFVVKHFWAPKSRLCQEVYDAQHRYGRQPFLEVIRNRADLLEHVKRAGDVRCFVMNASPIILHEPILERMDFFNIHPGSLVNNRGHHPHLWSILLDEKETEINLHSVTPEIDLGKVIACVKVPVLPDDTSLTLLNRAEDQIPDLLTALAGYLRGERRELGSVTQGGYRRMVTYEDYQLHLERDTVWDMSRKIRARAMHHGAFFIWNKQRVYVDEILGQDRSVWDDLPLRRDASAQEARLQLSLGTQTLLLTRSGERIWFKLRRITDLEGVNVWEPADENT